MSNDNILLGFMEGLRPEPLLSVSEWSDRHRYLSPTAAAEAGQWRTSRTPYLKEVMDKLSALDPTEEVVVMKGAQLGFTEAANNWVGYIIDVAPGPVLMVMPTDETVKRNSKIRIAPMIESSPRLRERVAVARSRDSSNTTYSKDFPGGVLVMTGANSAVGLRSMPVRYLLLDEVDGYPIDLDGEGSPIELAMARTRTFSRRKIFKISTPTVDGISVIQKEFYTTDQRYYHVPCPHCGTLQALIFEQLKWEKRKPETARYECEHCNELIEERFKTAMLSNGKWIATKSDNASAKKVGYHINSLYSPYGWYSWENAAKDWEDAQHDVNKLKTFVNTVLGETWKEKGEAPEWQNLYNRRSDYTINIAPVDVTFITAGVDVQIDRLELEVVGWCKGKRTYSIDYRVLVGDTANSEVWDKLAEVISETWQREDGVMIPLRLMAIDTGYRTSEVYDFCRKYDNTKVIPIKGQDSLSLMVSPPRAVDTNRNGKKINGIKVWHVGVSMIKSELYGWLRLEIDEKGNVPPGYCFFPQYDQNYFKGITAENLIIDKNNRGFDRYQWVKKFGRNEPLDCRVYARAAAYVVGIDRFKDEHYEMIMRDYGTKKTEPVKKKRSSYWG